MRTYQEEAMSETNPRCDCAGSGHDPRTCVTTIFRCREWRRVGWQICGNQLPCPVNHSAISTKREEG